MSYCVKLLGLEKFYLIYKLLMFRRNVKVKFLGVGMLIFCFGFLIGIV